MEKNVQALPWLYNNGAVVGFTDLTSPGVMIVHPSSVIDVG